MVGHWRVYLDDRLRRSVRIAAAMEGISIRAWVERQVNKALADMGKGGKDAD